MTKGTREQITIHTLVHAPLERVWAAWTTPKDMMSWNAASDDWHCPSVTIDLRAGGEFHARMEAKDGSFGFDFGGTYTEIIPLKEVSSVLGDGRRIEVLFQSTDAGVEVTETFEIEDVNSAEMQRQGWQSILDRFQKYVEQNNV